MSKQAEQTETKRGRGLPAKFPDRETIKRLYDLPLDTVEAFTAEAKRRKVPVGVFVDDLLSRSMKAITRKRKS